MSGFPDRNEKCTEVNVEKIKEMVEIFMLFVKQDEV